MNYIKDHPLGNYRMLNVNVPPLPMEKIKGVKFVPMETDRYRVYYDERRRGGFNDHLYYWLCEDKPECAPHRRPRARPRGNEKRLCFGHAVRP